MYCLFPSFYYEKTIGHPCQKWMPIKMLTGLIGRKRGGTRSFAMLIAASAWP
jgi:hypothetical protein